MTRNKKIIDNLNENFEKLTHLENLLGDLLDRRISSSVEYYKLDLYINMETYHYKNLNDIILEYIQKYEKILFN